MLEQILTDFRPTRVLYVGAASDALVLGLRERGVQVHIARPAELTSALAVPRCDLSICIDLFAQISGHSDGQISTEEIARVLEALCQHSDSILFSASAVTPNLEDLAERDLYPSSYWVTQFARRSFYRDVDYDAALLAVEVLCLRRLAGSNLPIIASYERSLREKERELAAQRLVSQEYRDALLERDLEVELLHKEVELESLGRELLAVRLRLAPSGTTRERYFNTAVVGVRKASRVAMRGLDLGEQLVRRSRALLRGRT